MKKTKILTVLVAVVFSLAMLFAMSVPALAADTTNQTDNAAGSLASNNPAIKTVESDRITLNKSLIVFNSESVNVYEPTIAYTYTVAPFFVDDGEATVSDGTNTVSVKDGVAGGLTVTTTPSFATANTAVSATPTGTIVEKPLVLTVDPTVFASTGAGVYRYKLTDTTSVENLNAVGITRPAGYKTDRYIDLYVTNGTDGLEVNNAVVFVETALSNQDPKTGDIITETEKTTGYNEGTNNDTDYTDDTAADHYYTYNLKVRKVIDGPMSDKTHQFPFAVSITGIKASKITSTQDNTTFTDVTVTSGAVGGTDLSSPTVSLKDGEYITYYGIPFGASATVKEYNNTYDVYTATGETTHSSNNVAFTAADLAASHGGYVDGTTAVAAMSGILLDTGTAHTQADNTQTVAGTTVATFTNEIRDISPTGLVFRIAPYVLMLAAGVSLVLLFSKRRREVTDMI